MDEPGEQEARPGGAHERQHVARVVAPDEPDGPDESEEGRESAKGFHRHQGL
jgi:hypothetical protein